MMSDWVYIAQAPAEDLNLYKLGGFHPLLLNTRLKDDRYEIWHKLGYGGFGTVWLARDTVTDRNVSIKILLADQSNEHSCRELHILTHLSGTALPMEHPGRRYVSTLKDYFYVVGPNGRHLCLVMDVVGPPASFVKDHCEVYRLSPKLAREASKQVLLAVDYLHECGVTHGDIHTGNVLFRYPGLDTLGREQIMDVLDTPQTGLVTRRDNAPCPENVPKYVVSPTEYKDLTPLPNFTEIQLIDFGGAFFFHEPPPTLTTPVPFHPPELVFHHLLSKPVDIWSLGHTIYEFTTGQVIFWVNCDYELPRSFEKVLGGMPTGWVLEAMKNGLFTEDQIHENDGLFEDCLSLEGELQRAYTAPNVYVRSGEVFSAEDLDILAKCLRRMLVVDPAKRATSRQLLTEEKWFGEDHMSEVNEGVKE
ncbi:kinase-like domain-containing protein [Tirmania nivea]|nr:kinase-like domain-containing protein [Tirmania nivea]